MKKTVLFTACLAISFSALLFGGELSEQQQQKIIEEMKYLRGIGPMPDSHGDHPQRCGTEVAYNFFMNRDNFTGKFAAEAEALYVRPAGTCNLSIVSPANQFKIHYSDDPFHEVFLASVDIIGPGGTPGADGVPDYVNKIADIADSVRAFIVDDLGYPPPFSDETAGGDSLTDIYILDLGPSYYGVTYADTTVPFTAYSIATYMVIDNNYDIYPYNTGPTGNTMERRLDAARVTIAHEFFHTIHFTMDRTEAELQGGQYFMPWWEMTSTWMEEMAYDDINDYYAYLDTFYVEPWVGLRRVFGEGLHQYGACVFPIFLTEKYDTSIILDIWQRCRDLGTGSQFTRAIDDALLADGTLDSDDLGTAFNEFSVWNYFTGTRANLAPAGYRFSEAEFYPVVPNFDFLTFNQYDNVLLACPNWPDTLPDGTDITFFKNNRPQILGTRYLKMDNLFNLVNDTLIITLFGNPSIYWDMSFIGFPTGNGDPVITSFSPELGRAVIDTILPLEFNYVIGVISPSTTVINNTNYLSEFCCGIAFSGDVEDNFELSYEIDAPYPNPFIFEDGYEKITFKSRIIASAPGKMAKLKVTIFNTSGEKIKVIDMLPTNGYVLNPIISEWKMDNESKEPVAPGVYLAYMELIFDDGTPGLTRKEKIAVIK